jgi:hypothetical protein
MDEKSLKSRYLLLLDRVSEPKCQRKSKTKIVVKDRFEIHLVFHLSFFAKKKNWFNIIFQIQNLIYNFEKKLQVYILKIHLINNINSLKNILQ